MYCTYILYSPSTDRYYTGHTGAGIEQRLERHNAGGSRSTRAGVPWELVYSKSFETKSEAIRWELHIKRQKSRAFLRQLITSADNEVRDR